MALNALGLGMTIRAKDMASATFQKVNKSMQSGMATARKFGAGMAKAGQAVRGLAMAATPFTIGMGLGVKAAADFEQGMANVKTIMRGLSDKEFAMLEGRAKELGATTSFSATQAADGMQILARQGFEAHQVYDAIGPVLKAAEVESIDLATSAQLVASNLRAFGKPASEASDVAGVLALASAKTATSMVGLGEGLKLAAPTANQLGISIEDTVGALGLLANVGIRGTNAGTALNNMLVKLSTASPAVTAKFKRMGIQIKDAQGNFVGLGKFSADLNKKLPEIGGNMDQVAFLAETMGLRGQRAGATLSNAITQMSKDGQGSVNAFEELTDALKNTGTIVDDMSADKLKTMHGSIKLLKSAVEGVAIEAFTPFAKMFGPLIKEFSEFVGGIAKGVSLLSAIAGGSKEAEAEFSKLSSTQQQMALGLRDALEWIKGAIKSVQEFFSGLKDRITAALGPDGVRKVTKFVAIFGAILAVAAPIAAAIAGIAFVISSVVVPAVSALGTILSAVFSPWGLAIAAAIALIWNFRDEIWAFGKGLWGALVAVWEPIKSELSAIWNSLKQIWDTVAGALSDAFGSVGQDAGEMGQTVGEWIGDKLLTVLGIAGDVVRGFADTFSSLRPILAGVVSAVGNVVSAIGNLLGKIWETIGAANSGGNAFQTLGSVAAAVFGAMAAIIGTTADIIAGAINYVSAIIGGLLSVISSIVTILVEVVDVIVAVLTGDWQEAWNSMKTIVFEVIKGIITIVSTMVESIAAAIDAIASIFGVDLGAQKFMEGVREDLVSDVEEMIKGQEQVARERAAARAREKPPAPRPTVVPPTVAPTPTLMPAVAAAAATGVPLTDAIDNLTATMAKQKVQAHISLTSTLKMDERVLAEQVEKVMQEMKARGTA